MRNRLLLAQVLTDELRVRQIVMNGLTNAVKYSNAPENGPIRVAVSAGLDEEAPAARGAAVVPMASSPLQHWLFVDVLDHGPGMGGVDENVLFTDFAAATPVHHPMLHSSHGNDYHVGSSGVGLPICSRCARVRVRVYSSQTCCARSLVSPHVAACVSVCHAARTRARRYRLAKLLGGDLHVSDRRDGVRGARFRLRLPLLLPPSPTPGSVGQGGGSALGSPASGARDVPPSDAHGAIRVKRRVLVVDDSEGNRRLLRRMLQQLGCYVLEAADGDEVVPVLVAAAAEAAGEGAGAAPAAAAAGGGRGGRVAHVVDLVLMDIEMTRMGGVAAVVEMRRSGWSVPVIAVTGHAGADDAAACACSRARLCACVRAPWGVRRRVCAAVDGGHADCTRARVCVRV
jgi:CheY-like chemotaxis protein